MLISIRFVISKNKFQFKVLPHTVFEIFAYFWFYKNLFYFFLNSVHRRNHVKWKQDFAVSDDASSIVLKGK